MESAEWNAGPEDEYVEYLNCERHMFAWCLVNIGGLRQAEADQAALERYPYCPPSDRYRWLVFHSESWHWAMIYVAGEEYWTTHPELVSESEEYNEECRRYESERGNRNSD
jgi:hypothetical protein